MKPTGKGKDYLPSTTTTEITRKGKRKRKQKDPQTVKRISRDLSFPMLSSLKKWAQILPKKGQKSF